jgi:hypothetical protein
MLAANALVAGLGSRASRLHGPHGICAARGNFCRPHGHSVSNFSPVITLPRSEIQVVTAILFLSSDTTLQNTAHHVLQYAALGRDGALTPPTTVDATC